MKGGGAEHDEGTARGRGKGNGRGRGAVGKERVIKGISGSEPRLRNMPSNF